MWISCDITVPSARCIAQDIRNGKRLAFHVMSLRMSRVAPEVLCYSNLRNALSSQMNHPGIGNSIKSLLERFNSIVVGEMDPVNYLWEQKKKSPFRQANPKHLAKIRARMDNSYEENSSESDYSDTDSESDAGEGSSRNTSYNEEIPFTYDDFWSISEEQIEKRPINDFDAHLPPKMSQFVSSDEPYYPDSDEDDRIQDDQQFHEHEIEEKVQKVLKEIFNAMKGKPMSAKGEDPTPKPKKRKEFKIPKKSTKSISDATKERKDFKKRKSNENGKEKSEKADGWFQPVKIEPKLSKRSSTASEVAKKLKLEKKSIINRQVDTESKVLTTPPAKLNPAASLAQKLTDLPLEPTKEEVESLLKGLTAQLLQEAEKIIGRNMTRVNRLWFELICRDFGGIGNSSGNLRDIYQAKLLLEQKRKEREVYMEMARLPPPPPPPIGLKTPKSEL